MVVESKNVLKVLNLNKILTKLHIKKPSSFKILYAKIMLTQMVLSVSSKCMFSSAQRLAGFPLNQTCTHFLLLSERER